MAMIVKWCAKCQNTAWHNPVKRTKDAPQEYRCTRCGHPKRSNGK